MNIKWMIIDLDNTILDFDAAAAKSLEITFMQFDVPVNTENILTYKSINHECWTLFEKGQIDIEMLKRMRFEKLVDALGIRADPFAMNHLYLKTLGMQVDEIDGSRDFLEWAIKKFDLILATNGFADVQRPRIRRANLQPYFKHIIISEEIGSQKPHKLFFEHTIEMMGHPNRNEVLMVGDSLSSDIAGGITAGIRTCWFNNDHRINSGSLKPDIIVSKLEEVREFLGDAMMKTK